MTITDPDAPVDPNLHPQTGHTVDEHLRYVDEQLRGIQAEEAADPSSVAIDPAGWQVRSAERHATRRRLESERRFVAEFRELAWRYDIVLTNYSKVARPIEARHADVLKNWTVSQRENARDLRIGSDVETWMKALRELFTALPQKEALVRSVLAREFARWLKLRNAAAVALASWRAAVELPTPDREAEKDSATGGLPSWLYVGAVRTDLLMPDPAIEP